MNKIEYNTNKPFIVGFVSSDGESFESGEIRLKLNPDLTKNSVWSTSAGIIETDTLNFCVHDSSGASFNETMHKVLYQAIFVRKTHEMGQSFDSSKMLDYLREFNLYLSDFLKNHD